MCVYNPDIPFVKKKSMKSSVLLGSTGQKVGSHIVNMLTKKNAMQCLRRHGQDGEKGALLIFADKRDGGKKCL